VSKKDHSATADKIAREASDARYQLPTLFKKLGLMDLDIDPERIDRLNEIFEQLDDGLVVEIADRLQRDQGSRKGSAARFFGEFGISPAEGRLLESLIGGINVVEHAQNSGISVNTARTQMRRLLEKTDSSGQLDLIRKYYGLHQSGD